MKNFLKFLVFVVLVSFGISLLYDYRMKHGGLVGPSATPEKYSLATAPPVDRKEISTLEEFNRERRTLVSNILPSVVSVKTSTKIAARRQYGLDPFEFFFRNPRQFRNPNEEAMVQNSLGSGVVVTNEGHIITNSHVVDQVDEIEVQLSDGRTKKARLIGADAQVDLAVLKIDEPGVKPLKLADSDTVQAGDFVLAIGNPFGFEETVTDGITSSKGRPNRADFFGDLLQTDQSGTESEGVTVDEVVPGSPAAQAKMQKGDVIRKFDGHDVKNINALRSLVAQIELNKNVELEVVRNGKPLKVTAQIKEQPIDRQTSGRSPQPGQPQTPTQPQIPGGPSGQ